MIQILAIYLDFEDAKNIQVFKSSFGALEDAGGSWLEFGIFILTWILSMIFDIPMIKILGCYLDFEDAKNIHVL